MDTGFRRKAHKQRTLEHVSDSKKRERALATVLRYITIAAAILELSGCASLPRIDPDLACVIPTDSERAAIAVIRQESSDFSGTSFVSGNATELLIDGPETYAVLRTLIRSAKNQIDLESYEFDGAVAEEFASLLIKKRQHGVRVHLIYDAWGSLGGVEAPFDRMRAAGIDVVEYNPFNPVELATLDLNRRDHRKLLIVDGHIAVTGGVNISEVYRNRPTAIPPANDPAILPWRDTDVMIKGPVVAQFEHAFLQTWSEQKGPSIREHPVKKIVEAGSTLVEVVDGSPIDQHPAIYRTMLVALAAARRSVHLTTGFFAPTPDLEEALACAARRGLDVRVIVPSISTSPLTVDAGRSHYEDLLEAGVRLYEREGVVLHAKTAVVDGIWSTVGSANLDWRSVVFNNEINTVILGPEFGHQLEDQFSRDASASREITKEAWTHRGFHERLAEWRARIAEFLL